MSRVLTVKSSRKRVKNTSSNCSVFSMRGGSKSRRSFSRNCRGSFSLNPKSVMVVLVSVVFMLGIIYLYQVNGLATKGYEIRDIEKKIAKLSQANKNNRIKEVELKSMYNIEKTAQDLNLVSAKEITYLNLNGPVAMK